MRTETHPCRGLDRDIARGDHPADLVGRRRDPGGTNGVRPSRSRLAGQSVHGRTDSSRRQRRPRTTATRRSRPWPWRPRPVTRRRSTPRSRSSRPTSTTTSNRSGGDDSVGALGYLLLLADAAGVPGTDFGGQDLVARLQATLGDFEPGLYGATDPSFDGVFRQGLAILGLVSQGVAPDPSATTWLTDQQCTSGGWEAYRADTSVPCGPPDPVNFIGPDSNSDRARARGVDRGRRRRRRMMRWRSSTPRRTATVDGPSSMGSTSIRTRRRS